MDRNSEGRRRYRSWPEELKREIVAATYEPGASVAGVAWRYGVNDNQIFAWRKRLGPLPADAARLVPVILTAETPGAGAPRDERIEIELAGGYRVRVGAGFDGPALRRVVDMLERR
ncbi:MAG: transposase [Rhodospirillales bacterium]|nr:transposase [Rhodospirillales bacterium]